MRKHLIVYTIISNDKGCQSASDSLRTGAWWEYEKLPTLAAFSDVVVVLCHYVAISVWRGGWGVGKLVLFT